VSASARRPKMPIRSVNEASKKASIARSERQKCSACVKNAGAELPAERETFRNRLAGHFPRRGAPIDRCLDRLLATVRKSRGLFMEYAVSAPQPRPTPSGLTGPTPSREWTSQRLSLPDYNRPPTQKVVATCADESARVLQRRLYASVLV